MDEKTKLYDLWHYKIGPEEEDGDEEQAKSIGIYSSKENAKATIKRLVVQPGFRDWPDGFRIFHRYLDKDTWVEGFVNSDDDPDCPRSQEK